MSVFHNRECGRSRRANDIVAPVLAHGDAERILEQTAQNYLR
jgi:hypothetical protein